MSAQWIHAAKRTRIPGTPLPAELSIPIFLVFIRPFSLMAWMVCLGSFFISVILHIKGRSAFWVWMRFRSYLRAGRIQARPMAYRRRFNRLRSYDQMDLAHVRQLPYV